MDVDTDGQRLANHHHQNEHVIDTTLEGAPVALDKGKARESWVDDSATPTTTHPEMNPSIEPTQILERPREGGDDGVRESPKHMPTIPQPPIPTLPLTQNLLTLYGLQPLAASVARFDPVTGTKINKLRKSYENQLKALGLAGRNRAVKHKPEKGVGLKELTQWPQEEWQNQKVAGKDVLDGLSEDIMAKLEKAMQMQPGPVPNNNEWEDQLGHEKVKRVEPKVSKIVKATTVTTKTNGQLKGNTTNAEAIRPKRTGRKRRYDEHSFEGYGEGYVDDEIEIAGGYSSGDTQFSRRSSTNKKRKKDYGNSPTGFGDRNGSFGTNMVGVTAYGR